MKYLKIKNTDMEVSEICLGLMRVNSLDEKSAASLLEASAECGINYYDHADIYGAGESERVFAKAVKNAGIKREDIYIQSKCGIRKGMFDFSKEHIISSVEGSLKRLETDYLDCLLLHRPDALCDPDEVAEAFDILKAQGKVRYFGVSNQKPMQIELLQKSLKEKIIFNQLQLSITNLNMISNGINVNMENDSAVDRDGSVLDYCRLKDITIQPWSPFQYGFFEGIFIDNPKFPELNEKLREIGGKYGVSSSAVTMAWILRHPAKMQPIAGTTNPERLKDICTASDFTLTREEWYEIYRAAGNILP